MSFQPVEMGTGATKLLQQRLVAAGEKTAPETPSRWPSCRCQRWPAGFEAAGESPTPAGFISGLRAVTDFDADGLLSPLKVSLSDYHPAQSCGWIVQLEGSKCQLVDGLDPICGTKITS